MTDDIKAGATGASFDLANAGYTEMPDPAREADRQPVNADGASLREVAERRAEPAAKTVVRRYTDGEGKPAAANEAVTLARAAHDYAKASAADQRTNDTEVAAALATHIDRMRAEVADDDPDAADFYGFEPPDADGGQEPDCDELGRPTTKQAEAVDPDLEKLMQHPQVRLALEEKVGEAERARQVYLQGLDAALQIAQASFIGQFPELAALPPEQLPDALAQIAQQDPAKLARIQAIVAGSEQLRARQDEERRRTADAAQRNFQNYAKTEDARVEAMLKDEASNVRQAVAQEIMASARASGIEPNELRHLFATEPLMRNATFQRMMYDAGKYRLMMKARDAVATKPMPPVQRPGTAASRGERDQHDLRALSARLSSSGDLKDAVALYQAKTAGRR